MFDHKRDVNRGFLKPEVNARPVVPQPLPLNLLSNANWNMTLVAVEQLLSDSLADLASNPGLLERKDT